MANNPLQITNASVRAKEAAQPVEAAAGRPPLVVAIEVENSGNAPLHVWSNVRAYEYDVSSRRLTLHLAEREPPLPPGIQLVSRHPQIPQHVVVGAGERSTVRVTVPGVIRRRVPGQGLGMSFVEEPIGPVDEIDVQIQHWTAPVTPAPGEKAEQLQARLQTTGEVTRSIVRIESSKDR